MTVVRDLIRGDVAFPNRAIEDFVCVKSNGSRCSRSPTSSTTATMAITHVIRGEEHLAEHPEAAPAVAAPSTSDRRRSAPAPVFAHLPLLVNEQRKKLSKRRDPVAVESYRDQGYLAEAFCNFLALLGWSPRGDDEIVDRATMIDAVRARGRQPLAGVLRRRRSSPT